MLKIVAPSSADHQSQHEVNEDGVSLDSLHEDAVPLTTSHEALQVQDTIKVTTVISNEINMQRTGRKNIRASTCTANGKRLRLPRQSVVARGGMVSYRSMPLHRPRRRFENV